MEINPNTITREQAPRYYKMLNNLHDSGSISTAAYDEYWYRVAAQTEGARPF